MVILKYHGDTKIVPLMSDCGAKTWDEFWKPIWKPVYCIELSVWTYHHHYICEKQLATN